MGYRFVSPDRDQSFLLPPDMRDWLPEDHLVWLVLDAVAEIDLAVFEAEYRADGLGRPAFAPGLMVALLVYGYAVGERSSRSIERRCREDVAFRVICAGLAPDHATIARFRLRHRAAFGVLFSQVLALLAEAGMVRLGSVALDGTKIAANASFHASKTLPQVEAMLAEAAAVDAAEDATHGSRRGDEAPPQLARRGERLARLRQARDRLVEDQSAREAAHAAKVAAYEERLAANPQKAGRRPNPEAPVSRSGALPRVNVTDPQARTMKSKQTLVIGYNAQVVVTADQVVVGAMVTQQAVDHGLLHPVLAACREQLTAAGVRPRLRTVLADAGYATEQTYADAEAAGLRLLMPPTKTTQPRPGTTPRQRHNPDTLPATARGERRLRHWRARADYKKRSQTVEPVFGQIKTRQRFTGFSGRGLAAASSEWHLACTAHNLLKLHTHRHS